MMPPPLICRNSAEPPAGRSSPTSLTNLPSRPGAAARPMRPPATAPPTMPATGKITNSSPPRTAPTTAPVSVPVPTPRCGW